MTFTTTWYDEHTKQIVPPAEIEAHDVYSNSRCDIDGSAVFLADIGNSTARCELGHRWEYIHPHEENGQIVGPAWRQIE